VARRKSKTNRKTYKIKGSPEIIAKLQNCLWLCRIGNFSETESLAFINSGELGYFPQTKEEKEQNKFTPITIGVSTYYERKAEIESPEYQTHEMFKIFREEYVAELISRFKLFKELEARSFKALQSESDPHKQQLIINGMFRNSPYTTSLMDIIKNIIERKKMPFSGNPNVIKILEQKEKKKESIRMAE